MHIESINNLLQRFIDNPKMTLEDKETTIRDIKWNIKQISEKKCI